MSSSQGKLDQRGVLDVAHLGRIEINSAGAEELSTKLSDVMDVFQTIASVSVHGSGELLKPRTRLQMRPDELKNSLGQDKALQTAPESYSGHFRVPPVL